METRYYICPYIDINPDPDAQRWAPKIHLYRDISAGEGYNVASAAWPYKDWCLAEFWAEPDAHADAQADVDVTLIPFFDGSGNYLPLSAEAREVVEPYRTNILNFLEARRIPAGWIDGGTTLGAILKYVLKLLTLVSWLKDNYPELPLDTQVNGIPGNRRQAVLGWMQNNGIETSDITNSWTVGQVLHRIALQYPWRAEHTRLGTALL